MAMLVYYTLSTLFPPRETYVSRTVESLDEDALDEQHAHHAHAHAHGHQLESSGHSDLAAEWEKASKASGQAPGSAGTYNKERAAV